MYVVMNRFTLNPGHHEAFEDRWRNRESHLKGVPGFIRFRLLRLDETHYSSYVEWTSEAHFVDWTQSEAFRAAHARASLPEGTLAGPNQLERWEVILEQA